MRVQEKCVQLVLLNVTDTLEPVRMLYLNAYHILALRLACLCSWGVGITFALWLSPWSATGARILSAGFVR